MIVFPINLQVNVYQIWIKITTFYLYINTISGNLFELFSLTIRLFIMFVRQANTSRNFKTDLSNITGLGQSDRHRSKDRKEATRSQEPQGQQIRRQASTPMQLYYTILSFFYYLFTAQTKNILRLYRLESYIYFALFPTKYFRI